MQVKSNHEEQVMNNKVELPKTATVPMPKNPRPSNSGPGPEAYAPRGHNSFLTQAMHEDVGRVMQNIIDLQAEVSQLREQRQEWERRALLAEGKVKQLNQDIVDLKEENARENTALRTMQLEAMAHIQKELDHYKTRDAVVQTKLAIGAQHFLDCMKEIEHQDKVKVLSGMEEELTKFTDKPTES
jgi:chromosome segregation ATPase